MWSGSRRSLAWKLHVSPRLKEKGLLVVFNPLNESVTKKLRVNLYYTGLSESARIREQGGAAKRLKLARDYTAEIPVTVKAQGMNWFVIE